MARTPPTPADLKARLPRFAAVADATIQLFLDEAATSVDDTWTEGDFAIARILLAGHLMVLEGIGGGAEAESQAQGMGVFKTMKSGALTLDRGDGPAAGGEDMGVYGQTSYGQRFWQLLARNQAGPISTGCAGNIGISPNARDWPNLPGLASRWPGNG